MLNWWLILLLVFIPILSLALSIYVLFYFQSEDDDGREYVPKIIFCLALVVALGVILLLPFDVANSPDPVVPQKYVNTLNTQIMWQVVLWMMAALSVVICPFTMFFYEAYDPDSPSRVKQVIQAAIMTIAIVALVAILTGICYALMGASDIPVRHYATGPVFQIADSDMLVYNSTSTGQTFKIRVTLTTYFMGMLCFLGWIFFCLYGGVGLLAYPINTIRNFVRRPKKITTVCFATEMAIVLGKADALLEVALDLQQQARGHMSRQVKQNINFVRNEVYALEAQQARLIWAYTKCGGSPFLVYGQLLLGILSLGVAVAWFLHIWIYTSFHVIPFLNTIIISLGDTFALLGIAAYSIFAFYLIWATFQGQISLGLRILFVQIHPMKRHDTLVNSFLFNVSLLLTTGFAVLQFVTRSFADYCPRSAIGALMNLYIFHLRAIGQVIRWAPFALMGIAIIAAFCVGLCPRGKRPDPRIIPDDVK